MDPAKLPAPRRAPGSGNEVAVAAARHWRPALARLKGNGCGSIPPARRSGSRRGCAPLAPRWWPAPDPCLLPKACKNDVEQQGARAAHRRDAVAICRFLHFLADAAPSGAADRDVGRRRLLAFRGEVAAFRGESFPAISGAGEHGAIIHYRVTEESDRPIRAERGLPDRLAVRSFPTARPTSPARSGPARPRRRRSCATAATRVLKGHIAIATLVFPHGVGGAHLDAFARRALWQVGLDYDHGTGHGVGSYLSVHEGPVSLSRRGRPVPIAAGMILSNEPGYYLPGAYGIRLENLLLVRPAELADGHQAVPALRDADPRALRPQSDRAGAA